MLLQAPPTALTENETLVLRAMLTRSRGFGSSERVTRPEPDTLRHAFEGAVRKGSFSDFQWNPQSILNWVLMVANSLSDGRLNLVAGYPTFDSWEALCDIARGKFTDKFQRDVVGLQSEYDAEPEAFPKWYPRAVVVEGKVVDPWGKDVSAPVQWWFDNLTLVMVWTVYFAVRRGIDACTVDYLSEWVLGDGQDPREVAQLVYSKGMSWIARDILALLHPPD